MASLPQSNVVAFPEPAPATPSEGGGILRRVLREPLTHFILIGAAIFAVMHVLEARHSRYVIRIGPEQIQRLASSYEQQYGAPPDAAQLRALVRERVRQDIFYREAEALGLDREDEVVRRRISEKYAFLMQDNVVPRAPDEADLRRYYDAHRQDYAAPARRSFEQAYFAIDERGEQAAKALAEQAARAAGAGAASAGDEFPGPAEVRLLSQADIGRTFGDEAFARQVFAARPGTWAGPFRSGFGWHLVRVTESEPGRPRSFAEVRADVARDWSKVDGEAQNRAAYDTLRARYRVEIAE